MSGKGRPQETINSMAHRHYAEPAIGDATHGKVEFSIGQTVYRVEDIMVFVGGRLQRVNDRSGPNDYGIRGLTNDGAGSPYNGDSNMIKFNVAPADGLHVTILSIGG